MQTESLNCTLSAGFSVKLPENAAYKHLTVIKRNNTSVPFDIQRISNAIANAFLDVKGKSAFGSTSIHDIVEELTDDVCQQADQLARVRGVNTVHVEEIQDQVELSLMRKQHFAVARSYVLYREKHRQQREALEKAKLAKKTEINLHITLETGKQVLLEPEKLHALVQDACLGLQGVCAESLVTETIRNLFDGVAIADVHRALIMSARTQIEQEPDYAYVAARLLLGQAARETYAFLGLPKIPALEQMQSHYAQAFKLGIERGIKAKLFTPALAEFNLEKLGDALVAKRDLQFNYLGLQTLYDRYFVHIEEKRIELPQTFFMRVAMGLALREKDKEEKAVEFYELLSTFQFMSSTPTLFNSGTQRAQLSSCYLSTIPDDLDGIYSGIKDNALLQKFAGGIGNDWTPVRAMNSHITGTNGKSLGIVPFLKVANDTAVAVNQGGKRKGAVCAYLETWHLDIEEFIELRKNTGDDRRRTHDMHLANWIPDLFMKRMILDQKWTLFSPCEVPQLHDLYGSEFDQAYEAAEKQAENGKIKNFKVVSAKSLWRKMLGMLFETGHPWMTFKDACNLRSPQQHAGVIHSSNLCTEITLNTSVEEIAVCNLGSVNLIAHVQKDGLNEEKLKKTIQTAVRMLDNVIDINYYTVWQAKNSNFKHRPIGLGLMGFQDLLYQLDIPFGSKQAVEFSDKLMEKISYYALEASCDLAFQRGAYESFKGSLWDKGILPIDSIELLAKTRGEFLTQNREQRLDWGKLRDKIQQHGIRNSNVLSIAPTATISNICGVSQSTEPTYQNLFVKSNLSGEFTVINPYLIRDLKKLELWDKAMLNDLKYYNGSVQKIECVPQHLKEKYKTAFELDSSWLIECAARRQKWIDQSQSLNLYMAEPSGVKLEKLYKSAWTSGLKTTYYLRSLGATDAEKSTINRSRLNAVKTQTVSQAVCSIEDPDCEACQ